MELRERDLYNITSNQKQLRKDGIDPRESEGKSRNQLLTYKTQTKQ